MSPAGTGPLVRTMIGALPDSVSPTAVPTTSGKARRCGLWSSWTLMASRMSGGRATAPPVVPGGHLANDDLCREGIEM